MTGGFHFQIYFGKIKIYERDVKLILTSFLFTIKPDITVGDDGFYMDYMREDFKLRNSGKILCIASLLGLLVLSGCGLKSEPAVGTGADGAAVGAEGTVSAGADEGRADEDKTDGNGTDQEIHIYSDTRAGDSAGDETVPAANGGSIIQDQSFDVELDSLKAAEPPAKESISETRVVSEEIIRQASGSWTLNGPKTDAGLRQHGSLLEMFGTGLHMGNGLEISDNGEIEYYIGIGTGGEGQCTETGGSTETGSSITASITPYEDHGNSQNSLTLHLITEDDTEYLTMEYDGEILYWNR